MIMKVKISFDKNSHFFAYGSIQRTNKKYLPCSNCGSNCCQWDPGIFNFNCIICIPIGKNTQNNHTRCRNGLWNCEKIFWRHNFDHKWSKARQKGSNKTNNLVLQPFNTFYSFFYFFVTDITYSLLSFGRPQFYNLEIVPFIYDSVCCYMTE